MGTSSKTAAEETGESGVPYSKPAVLGLPLGEMHKRPAPSDKLQRAPASDLPEDPLPCPRRRGPDRRPNTHCRQGVKLTLAGAT